MSSSYTRLRCLAYPDRSLPAAKHSKAKQRKAKLLDLRYYRKVVQQEQEARNQLAGCRQAVRDTDTIFKV